MALAFFPPRNRPRLLFGHAGGQVGRSAVAAMRLQGLGLIWSAQSTTLVGADDGLLTECYKRMVDC